jgi:hypothetical protein
MRWAGHVARMGEERKVYKVLVGKPERKRPLGRPMRRWRMRSDCILGRLAGEVWCGLWWLWLVSGGVLLLREEELVYLY